MNDSPSRGVRMWGIALGVLVVLVPLGIVMLVVHLHEQAHSYPTPAGWHQADPPQVGQVTNFGISQDVPGLVFSITGDYTGSRSTDTSLLGTLWRTRNGGTQWEELTNHPNFHSGATLALVQGGKGALVVADITANGALYFSPDAGATWQTLHFAPTQQIAITDLTLFARDGALYLFSESRFWRSTDGGQTWQARFEVLDSNSPVVSGIAPDYQAAHAWYRLTQFAPLDTTTHTLGPSITHLEHSSDDGQTWQSVQTLQPDPQSTGGDTYEIMGALATNPAQPAALCLAMGYADGTAPHATTDMLGALQPFGPPGRSPQKLFLASSSDGGKTTSAHVIAPNFGGYGMFTDLALDDQGNCRAVVTPIAFYTDYRNTELWTLATGSGTAKVQWQNIAGVTATAAAIIPSGAEVHVTLAAYASHGVIRCINNDACPDRFAYPTHLLWRDLTSN